MLNQLLIMFKSWFTMRGIKAPEKAQGLIEYALIVFLISVAVIAALMFLSDEIRSVFDFIITTLNSRIGGG